MFTFKLAAATLLSAVVAVHASIDAVNWNKTSFDIYDSGVEFADRDQYGSTRFAIHTSCYDVSGPAGQPREPGHYLNMSFVSWTESPYTNSYCKDTNGGIHLDFEIANLSPDREAVLDSADCERRFYDLLAYSTKGGESQENGWYYRLDPQEGSC